MQPCCILNPFRRAVIKLSTLIKIRTYAHSSEELWLDEWRNPLHRQISITEPSAFLEALEQPIQGDEE